MRRLYPALALAFAGLLGIGCREETTPAPTEPQFERLGRIEIDGVIGRNEWRDAETLHFMASAPEGLVPAELLALRDDRDLFLAVRVQRPAGGLDGSLSIEFDNDNDGEPLEEFDDFIATGGVPPADGLGDLYLLAGARGYSADVEDGGTSDGAGAAGSDAGTTVYEIRKPLNSKDIHDFSLTRLTREVGIQVALYMTIPGGTSSAITGEWTLTQVPTYQRYCTLTAIPRLSIGGCSTGDVATVRITPRQTDPVVSLITMGTHQAFLEPLGLFTYDYLGNPVTATCTWQSDNPSVVAVDEQGGVSTGAATGTAAVGAVCLNTQGKPILGTVKITVE
ncbi:MAG TPA: hypothetical protein VF046_08020 [Gemmatimonadales bacterium]